MEEKLFGRCDHGGCWTWYEIIDVSKAPVSWELRRAKSAEALADDLNAKAARGIEGMSVATVQPNSWYSDAKESGVATTRDNYVISVREEKAPSYSGSSIEDFLVIAKKLEKVQLPHAVHVAINKRIKDTKLRFSDRAVRIGGYYSNEWTATRFLNDHGFTYSDMGDGNVRYNPKKAAQSANKLDDPQPKAAKPKVSNGLNIRTVMTFAQNLYMSQAKFGDLYGKKFNTNTYCWRDPIHGYGPTHGRVPTTLWLKMALTVHQALFGDYAYRDVPGLDQMVKEYSENVEKSLKSWSEAPLVINLIQLELKKRKPKKGKTPKLGYKWLMDKPKEPKAPRAPRVKKGPSAKELVHATVAAIDKAAKAFAKSAG